MKLLSVAHVKRIRAEILPILSLLCEYELNHREVVITGWAGRPYRPDGAHADNRGLDLRTRDREDADELAQYLRDGLYPISPHYIVLWGDAGHRDHIHVGYHKETRGRA